jgi:hypothetical protein
MFQAIRQAHGAEALGRSVVFKRHKRFAQERDSSEDDEHAGLPRTVTTQLKIQEAATSMRANRSQTVDEVAAATGISHGTRHRMTASVV